jgi:hypothetical protein
MASLHLDVQTLPSHAPTPGSVCDFKDGVKERDNNENRRKCVPKPNSVEESERWLLKTHGLIITKR